MSFFDNLLWPLKVAVAWIMVRAHDVLTFIGMDPAGGWTWLLSIVALVLVIRVLLIPLFVRQIKASRGMQLVQPEMQKLQKKYKGKTDPASRQAMQQEMMALYKDAGTSPFASCLPIIAQMPIFFALFRVLVSLQPLSEGKYARPTIGPLTQQLAAQAESSEVFGASLSSTFLASPDTAVKIVTAGLILIMSATTLFTQRQLTMKNMPASALDNPMAKQQKMMMYILPLVFAFSGVNFPIGVLVYWSTSNLWSMGQQFFVIRNSPAPGSEAEKAYQERQARKARRRGKSLEDEGTVLAEPAEPRGQREQPKRKERQKRTGPQLAAAGAGGSGEPTIDGGDDEEPTGSTASTKPGGSKPGGQGSAGAAGTGGKNRPKKPKK